MNYERLKCTQCDGRGGALFDHPITMAFQPIFDLATGDVFAQEALLRGPAGQSAGEILALVDSRTLYSFDQTCRVKAIEMAARLGLAGLLSINFLPNAVREPETCIARTLAAAKTFGFPTKDIIFELSEIEEVRDKAHIKSILTTYKEFGFRTAIDDFGAGFSGLSLIADVVPDIIKIDREIICHIADDPTRRVIARALRDLGSELGILVVAEGVETADAVSAVSDLGIPLAQGYALARPQFEALRTVSDFPLAVR